VTAWLHQHSAPLLLARRYADLEQMWLCWKKTGNWQWATKPARIICINKISKLGVSGRCSGFVSDGQSMDTQNRAGARMQPCRTPDVVGNREYTVLSYWILARYYGEELLPGSAGYPVHLYFVKLSTELPVKCPNRLPAADNQILRGSLRVGIQQVWHRL